MNCLKVPLLVSLLISMIHVVPVEARGDKRIGVLLWSAEPRYTESQKGVMEQLKKEGFGEPSVKFIVENAAGNKAKAAEVAHRFAAAKMDLVVAVGTTAAIAVTGEIKDVPVVFSMVYDPVETKIARDWKSSGNNTTGASPKVPLARLVHSLKELTPVKKLAVLYTPGEKNSEAQLKELQGAQDETRVKVVPVPLTSKEDVVQILPEVVRSVDAVYLSGSSVVGATVGAIVEMATRAKVVTISHLDDLVDQGVLLGVCANPYVVGRLAGEKAARVLRGAKPAAIPIESLKKVEVIINMKTARAGKFQVPSSFMKSVTKVVE